MTQTIRLVVAGAALVLAAVAAMAVPAGAIETATFGIDVIERDTDGRLRIAIAAGETTSGQLRVWSKHDEPLVLRLSVMPAEVADDGTSSLGGDPEPTGWVDVPVLVELAPGQERRVTVTVSSPRELSADTKTVAVLAQAEVDGEAPAVLQRLAVTTYLVPDGGSLIASLGWLPWLAAGVLVAVLGVLGNRALRSRA
jgi:hypothetical protein